MSILAASKSNINFNNILKSVKKIKPVPGRLEKISNLNNNSIVILDYAHTPDALKVCLSNLKDQFSLKKINLVFGCGGERDIPKRAIMGKIANIYCKKVYLTDDNPRRENPKIIRKKIKIKINKKKLIEIPSRKLAINTAIKNAKSDEIVVVAGKGHETYQEYKKKKYFSDRDCILQSIKEKNKKSNKNWKTNVVEEKLKTKLKNKTIINKACINSKEIKKNNIFFGITGKNIDGNKFANIDLKKSGFQSGKKLRKNKNKIKVKTLKFLLKVQIELLRYYCNWYNVL